MNIRSFWDARHLGFSRAKECITTVCRVGLRATCSCGIYCWTGCTTFSLPQIKQLFYVYATGHNQWYLYWGQTQLVKLDPVMPNDFSADITSATRSNNWPYITHKIRLTVIKPKVLLGLINMPDQSHQAFNKRRVRAGPTYLKLSDIRWLICEKFNFRKLGVSATEIAILKENRVRLTFTLTMLSRLCY